MFQFKFNETSKVRVDYGTKKHRSATDKNDNKKLWAKLEDETLKPYQDYNHLMECLVYSVNRTWNLRGQIEPLNLKMPDFFELHETGVHFGLYSAEIISLRREKNGNLSFSNTSFVLSFDDTVFEDRKNKYGVVTLMRYYIDKHLPIGHIGNFFYEKGS